jgi:cytochrome c oxidase assembly protein subunit 11
MAEAARGRPAGPHLKVAAVCALIFAAMVGLAYAAVPFYRAFCQATGFDGTPRRVLAGPTGKALSRTLLIRFDTNVRGDLPWRVRIGATSMAYFTVKNLSPRGLTGRAAYNVSPESAAHYFLKLQCFCFSDQTIPGGAERTFPVVFYVDPRFADDPDTKPLSELTLSYTYFPAQAPKAAAPQGG